MKRTVYITILGLIIIFFTSCAKPNEVPDVAENNALSIEHFYPTVGYCYDVFATDSLLYIAEDQGGYSIYNYETQSQRCHYNTDIENIRMIFPIEEKNLLFVYDIYGSPAGIDVYDISDITAPTTEGIPPIWDDTQQLEDMYFELRADNNINVYWSRYAEYTHGIYGNLWINSGAIDTFPNSVAGFDIDEQFIYLSGEQVGIYIAEKGINEVANTINTVGSALDVKKVDDYIFVADRQEGFSVYNVADIMNPEFVYSNNLGELIYTVEIEDNIMVLTSHSGGIYVYDITNVTEPELLGNLDDELGYTYKSVIKNGKVFAGTRTGVFEISIDQQ